MHGAGNDYIYVNVMDFPLRNPQELAVLWSDRHKGIGADGLVLIGFSEIADFSMRIFNADGSEGLMCGNAARCIGRYVFEKGLTDKKVVKLETLSGIKELALDVEYGVVKRVTVDMGKPVADKEPVCIEADNRVFKGTVVSMGNPHFVVFTDDVAGIDLPWTGPLVECHPFFADRTNVEFAEVIGPGVIRMRVWERGSGITMACGTGACATAVAAALTGRAGRQSRIVMDGGELGIVWDEASGRVFMSGGAEFVFEGEIAP